jgi:pimeloyl-ACP methyl ester carboxylesterase
MNLKNKFANFLAVAALTATMSVCAAAHTAPVESEIEIGSLLTSAPSATIDQPTTCQQSQLTVALEAGQPATYHVAGQLCYKPNNKNIVHLLVSGATYSRAYWDFPLQPQQYSYVRKLTNAGYATFNFDRLGIGESDHPPADQVTVQSNAFVVHQIVQALRDGRLGTFAKVILVGHSLGSGVATVEAAQYGDADGLVLTSFLHAAGPGFAQLPSLFYPASLDPRFAGQNLPDGYFTTLSGGRSIFYWTPNADPDVIALDELTKETLTLGEIMTFPPLVFSPGSVQGISAPVLIVMGQYDNGFCTPPTCAEAYVEPNYYPSAQVEVKVMPNAGHDLSLQRNAPAFFATVLEWSNRHFGN